MHDILPTLLHQTLFGGVAAAGFGILFNFGWRDLVWCALCGALALAVRTLGTEAGWPLEAASFVAAASVGGAGRLLRAGLGVAGNALAVAGCIPMIPGSFATQAIFGLFTLSLQPAPGNTQVVTTSVEFMVRVAFTIAAIGAGLLMTTHLLRRRDF
ncbi:MAG: threonine/serine exporter [Telmatospirillum sp.]|nr:threonine/serine exporter [Telmatospirillum sp.]